MSDADIIKHVSLNHKKAEISVEDVWQEMQNDFGRQTINSMLRNGGDSLANDETSEGDSKFVMIGMLYLFGFGFIWFLFKELTKNQSELIGYILFSCGVLATLVTIFFMNSIGKNERNYHKALNKLSKAYSDYTTRGFNNL
jgi:hypothetical protein